MGKEQLRVVLIGAGSAQFGYSTMGDIFQSEVLRDSKAHIVLHDINPDTMAVVAEKGQAFIDEHQLPFTLSATTSREKALQGADFCIISIEVGHRFNLWEQDWQVPLQFGMRQVYGENGGPGGFFHSLRVIPPILDICEDVMRICPQAFVFNFSNPMSRICTTVYRKFENIRFIGLCHEIASLSKHLPKLLDTPLENIHFRAGGLNHFSVLLEAKYRDSGKDAYPQIRAKAADYFEHLKHLDPPRLQNGKSNWQPHWQERGVFRTILEKYDLLPITTDSHFGEYLPWAYEVADHEGILDFYNSYKRDTMGSEPKIEMKLTERVVPIMEGIITDSGYEEAAVNVPNKGFIADFPDFMVVEVPAIVNKDGVHGISIKEHLPPGFVGLLYNQVAIHSLTAETILQGSRDVALQALLADPIVDKVGAAEKMLDHMLDLQKDYLSYID